MAWLKTRKTRIALAQRPRCFQELLRIELLEDRCVPSTITPTTFADGGLGSGSLRDAVLQFNADAGTEDDIIQLLPGTYALTIRNTHGHETAGLEGDVNLTQTSHRWIIQGAGPSTVIDASLLQDRVFDIVNPATQVVFQDLFIQGGQAQDNGTDGVQPGTTDALGGGILNNGGDLTLDDVILQNNVARGGNGVNNRRDGYDARGGGLYSTGGSVTIPDSTIAGNQANGGHGYSTSSYFNEGNGGNGAGGGIYAMGPLIDITHTTISGNTVQGGDPGNKSGCRSTFCYGVAGGAVGGGLYASGGLLTLSNATISANTAYGGSGNGGVGLSQGGGVYDNGTLTIRNSTITTNILAGGTSQGGGVYTSGTLTVSSSTIASNRVSGIGGLRGGPSQGGGLYGDGTVTIINSTITVNTATGSYYGGAAQGGGLYGAGTVTISSSTIAANTGRGGDGGTLFFIGGNGGAAKGGGLYASGMVTLDNSTVAANVLRGGNGGPGPQFDGGGDGGAGQGGGLWVAAGTTMQVSFSTIAANQATGGTHGNGRPNGSDGPATGGGVSSQGTFQVRDTLLAQNTVNGPGSNSGPDLAGNLGSLGHNLISNSAGGRGFDATDLLDVDPLLGPLQDNGGPTQTMTLLPGSPAIGAGDKSGHPRWDQRGRPYRRVVNHRIDIGAFEVQSDDPGPAAPGNGRGDGPALASLLSDLLAPAHHTPIWSAAPLSGPAAIPNLNRAIVPKQETESEPKVVTADRFFASFEKAYEPRPTQRRDPEPIQSAWPNVDLMRETAGLIW